jgi:Ca2+-binding EF-hand superfamily protein
MGFFNVKRPSPASNNSGSKGASHIRDFFSRHGYGGRISPRRFAVKMRSMPMRPVEKEYVKSVMRKFDAPFSRGITKKEFMEGLDEMKKNKRDRITEREIKRIKKHFQ